MQKLLSKATHKRGDGIYKVDRKVQYLTHDGWVDCKEFLDLEGWLKELEPLNPKGNNMCDEKERLDAIDKREAEEKALNKRADEIYEDREMMNDILTSIYDSDDDERFIDLIFDICDKKIGPEDLGRGVEWLRWLKDKHAYMLAEKE